MITFTVSFLLAIKLPQFNDPVVSNESPKVKKAKKAKAKTPKSKKSKKESKSKKTDKTGNKAQPLLISKLEPYENDENLTVFHPGKPVATFVIDYELFNNLKYSFEVTCWGRVVQKVSEDGATYHTTAIQNDLIWIGLTNHHYIQSFNNEELVKFLKYTIPFRVTFTQKAKNESGPHPELYMFTKSLELNKIDHVFLTPPIALKEDEDVNMSDYIKIVLDKIIIFVTAKIASCAERFDEVHLEKMYKVLDKIENGKEVHCNTLNPQQVEKSDLKEEKKKSKSAKSKKSIKSKKSAKSAKSKKSKKEKTPSVSPIQILVPAQMLFTDPKFCLFHLPTTNDSQSTLVNGFLMLTCRYLLKMKQKFDLAPLTIRLQKINNLPFELLEKNGYKKAYLECQVPNIANFRTRALPVARNMIFNESFLLYMCQIEPIRLLEILQTKNVIVEVCPEIEEKATESAKPVKQAKKNKKKEKKKPAKKGKKKSKKEPTSTEPPAEIAKPIVLARATFNLSSMLKTYWEFKERGPLYNISHFFSKLPSPLDVCLDRLTVNEINLVLDPNEKNQSPLSTNLLIENNASVLFEAEFVTPQYPSFYIRNLSNTYRRLMVIMFKEEMVKYWIRDLIQHLRTNVGGQYIFNMNLFSNIIKEHPETFVGLSGYMVDDGSNYIIFLEGESTGVITKFIHKLNDVKISAAKVFYNSNYTFERRCFKHEQLWNGYMQVTLKMPLKMIFEKSLLYVRGNVPVPSMKALQKLNLMINSHTLDVILHSDLILNDLELLSLSIEWGVPMQEQCVDDRCEKADRFLSNTDLFLI